MNELIRRRLTSNEALTGLLAKVFTSYGEEPAIFYQRSPADTDTPESLYPQIILTADKYSDAQKGVAGQLIVDIITAQLEEVSPPEPIERLVRQSLENVFFRGEEIFSIKWKTTEIFSEPASEKLPLIYGATMTFDLYEWPSAETSTPDPIEALNFWASATIPDLMVIGATEFEEFFEPTRERPAVYFDIERQRLTDLKTTAVFLDVWINIHIFAPTIRARREWLTAIHEELLLIKGVWLSDDSPMRLIDSEYDWTRTETEGQIQMKFNYGIMRKRPYAHTVTEIKQDNINWRSING